MDDVFQTGGHKTTADNQEFLPFPYWTSVHYTLNNDVNTDVTRSNIGKNSVLMSDFLFCGDPEVTPSV